MDRFPVPEWAVHDDQAVRDCCGLVVVLAARRPGDRILTGRLHALLWAVLGGRAPITGQPTDVPTRDQAEDEWAAAGRLDTAAAADPRTEGVLEQLGWLLGWSTDVGVTLPVRRADGSPATGRDATLARLACDGLAGFDPSLHAAC